jgi:hypothetical protein
MAPDLIPVDSTPAIASCRNPFSKAAARACASGLFAKPYRSDALTAAVEGNSARSATCSGLSKKSRVAVGRGWVRVQLLLKSRTDFAAYGRLLRGSFLPARGRPFFMMATALLLRPPSLTLHREQLAIGLKLGL